jgi:hypothetical protein
MRPRQHCCFTGEQRINSRRQMCFGEVQQKALRDDMLFRTHFNAWSAAPINGRRIDLSRWRMIHSRQLGTMCWSTVSVEIASWHRRTGHAGCVTG